MHSLILKKLQGWEFHVDLLLLNFELQNPCIAVCTNLWSSSIIWVNEFSCLDIFLLFAGNFTEHSRVTDLLDVKFAVPVISFSYDFCIYPYSSSQEIENHNTPHFMK
jgi:hypothetical protein